MIVEPFATGNSLLHRLDPRGKLVAAALLTLVTAVADRWATMIAAAGIALLLVALGRLPAASLRRRLLAANLFIAFLWLLLPFTVSGRILWRLPPLALSVEGVMLAARVTLKANAILLIFIALVGTTPVVVVGQALQDLRLPAKLVYLLLFTYRYIHVLELEYRRLHNAMTVRGFRPRTDRRTYRAYAHLVGMLLVRSLSRAERVYEAMLCRGFNGRFHSLARFSLSRVDVATLSMMLVGVGGLMLIEWLPTT